MPEDLTDSIAESTKSPKRAQGDSGSVEQHSLTEQIEADRYLASELPPITTPLTIRLCGTFCKHGVAMVASQA